MSVARLLGAVNAVASWSDRAAAIVLLQNAFAVQDIEEVQNSLIKPGGQTFRELVAR